jgi:hypothetical protein
MPDFNNDKATDAERVKFLDSKDAMVEDHGDEDDPEWVLFYGKKSMTLDSSTYEEALFEACNFLKD